MGAKKVDEATAAAFAGVEYAEMAFQAFEFARTALPRHVVSHDDPNLMAVRSMLVANVGEAYRRLFMWSTVHVDETVRRRAKELAMRRFLASNHEIMSHLHVRGEMPGGWLDDDEKQFRDEIAALMDAEANQADGGDEA